MYVTARWPDGSTPRYYSPSLVVREYLDAPASYPVAEFLERARSALHIASERVRAQYGFPCSRAAATLASIEAKASEFAHLPQAAVHVVALTDATATD
jgi:uncharacterized repeat protein (TIGR04042 family)